MTNPYHAGGGVPYDVVLPESELGACVRSLRELQAYGAERLAASGYTSDDIPMLVERALVDPDPVALAHAR